MTFAEKYKEEGREHGMCDKVYQEINADTSKDELVAKWVANIDFALQSGFPTPQKIKDDFHEVIHDHGVYVDERVYENNRDIVVINGDCSATLTYKDKCGRVYVRNNSKAHIRATGHARVFVSIYDDSEIDVFTGYFAKVFVYRYGNAKISLISGNCVERDRTKL